MNNLAYVGSELALFANATNWKRYWSSQVRPYFGERVFDVGAGLGANLRVLWHPGASWLCIEPDAELAKEAEETMAELGITDHCTVFHGTVAQLDPKEMADTIIYIDVIEHIEDDHAELRLAMKHLRPGGHIIVLVPAYQWLFSPFDDAVGHFRRYTSRSLSKIVPKELKLKRLRHLDTVGLLASTANRFILRSSTPNPSQIAFWDRVLLPVSRVVDRLFAYRVGKSVLGIWQLPDS